MPYPPHVKKMNVKSTDSNVRYVFTEQITGEDGDKYRLSCTPFLLRAVDSPPLRKVLAFSDTPDGVYGKAPHDAASLSRESTGEAPGADDDKV